MKNPRDLNYPSGYPKANPAFNKLAYKVLLDRKEDIERAKKFQERLAMSSDKLDLQKQIDGLIAGEPVVEGNKSFRQLTDEAAMKAKAQTKEEAIASKKEDLKKIYGVMGVGENKENILVFIRKESVTDMLPLTICGKPVKAIVTGKVIAASVVRDNEFLTEEYVEAELNRFTLDNNKEDMGPIENAFHSVKDYKPSENSVRERAIEMTPELEKALTLNQPLSSGKK